MEQNKVIRRKPEQFRDARVFWIGVEGEKTESAYFDWIENELGSPRLKVEVISTPSAKEGRAVGDPSVAQHEKPGASSPRAVAQRLTERCSTSASLDDDERWVVVDFDRWERQLVGLGREAAKGRFELAVSRPAFEIWLLFHFAAPTSELRAQSALEGTKTCTQLLRKHAGSYTKRGGLPEGALTLEAVEQAVERARLLDVDGEHRWPQSPGSHVYKLIERLLDVAGRL